MSEKDHSAKERIAEELTRIAFDRNEKTADRLRALSSLNAMEDEAERAGAVRRLDSAIAEMTDAFAGGQN